ncbi:hypothetical protein [Alteribacter lacisalsi]|jgi:hypothetical protein|nr:hypothetical protein [Alteribacter lacisalsi]
MTKKPNSNSRDTGKPSEMDQLEWQRKVIREELIEDRPVKKTDKAQ